MGLYKRGASPFWWFSFKRGGRRIQESTGVTDKKQAQEIYFKRRNDYAVGKALNLQTKLPLKKVLDTYLKDYARTNKLSFGSDETAIKTLLGFFGDCEVTEVTPQRLEQYKSHRRRMLWNGRQISGARINRELAILKCVFNKGMEWGLVVDNPVRQIKFFNEKDRSRTRFLSPEEKARLLAQCSPRLYAVVLTALKTGMRQGEIFGLKWADVNFSANQITLKKTKSGALRHIPIHPDVRDILEKLPKKNEHVFCDDSGARLSRFGILRYGFEDAVEKAGLRDFRFHDLRHTFASELVMKGVDIKTVADLLGHSTTRMTERYAHLSPSHKSLAITLLPTEKKTHKQVLTKA